MGDEQSATITEEQFRRLRRDVEETKWLTHTVIVCLIGKDKADAALAKIDEWLDSDFRRFAHGTAVYNLNLGNGLAYSHLIEADLFTLEEVAHKTRGEVAAVKGVGRVAMGHLEAAMAERGLSFVDAA